MTTDASRLCLFAVVLLAALAYAPIRHADFVYEDRNPNSALDPTTPMDNRGPWRGWADERFSLAPRGLTNLTVRAQGWAHATAQGFHTFNVAVHLVNGGLVYLVALPFGAGVAVLASTVFLLHPLNSEAVNYVSARTDLLYAMAVLLMLLAARSASWPRMVAVLVCGGLAVWAKESAIVVVGLLPLWLWFERRWSSRWLVVLGAWVVVGLAVVYRLMHPWGAIALYTSDAAHGFVGYAAYQSLALLRLAWLAVRLKGFSIDPDMDALPMLDAGLALAVVVALAACAWLLRDKARPFTFAVGWLLVVLSLRFVWPMPEYLHEQHAYVAFLGIWIALAASIKEWAWTNDGCCTRLAASTSS